MPRQSRIENVADSLMGARKLRDVVKHDTNPLADGVPDFLWIGAAGTIIVIAEDDTLPITLTVPVGRCDIRAKIVKTGGTATGIVACY